MNRIGGAGKSPKALEPNSALWNKGFVIIILVSCLVSFGNFIVGSAFSYWIIDIGGTRATFGLVHGLYSALCLISRPITGWFADNGNRRVTFILSCFVYVSSMILMLFSPIFGLFVGLRLIQGLVIAGVPAVAMTYVSEEVDPHHVPRIMGLYVAGTAAAGTQTKFRLFIETSHQHVVKIVRGLTDDQKRQFVIKDNGSMGEWDFDLLANNWSDLPLDDWGVDLPSDWANSLDMDSMPEAGSGEEKKKETICPKCGFSYAI